MIAGNRWEDAGGRFSTLECATSAEAAFGEAIAVFRERPGLLARIDAFLAASPDPEYDYELQAAVVPPDYLATRVLGRAPANRTARFIDVDHADTHLHASRDLARLLQEVGRQRFDREVMMSPDRRITRPVATFYHRISRLESSRRLRGLRYQSRLDGGWECWALWRPLPLKSVTADVTVATANHPDLAAAARRLRLRLLPGA